MANASQSAMGTTRQHSLAKTLGIWVLAAAPMGLLAWVVFPALVPGVAMEPGILLWILMIIGMMWQVVLSLAILYREEGTLDPPAIRHRTWRQRPRDLKTGQPRGKLWLWLIPVIILEFVLAMGIGPLIDGVWTSILPYFAEPPGFSLEALADTPERWIGAWYLLALRLLQIVGNYLWGEEFLFRSVLLPKMQGMFGKRDWLANAVLFGTYHWHKPWVIPGSILGGLLYAYPSRRFRCAWFGLIVHGAKGLFFLFIMLGLVLGLA